jgi:hypothetical protein
MTDPHTHTHHATKIGRVKVFETHLNARIASYISIGEILAMEDSLIYQQQHHHENRMNDWGGKTSIFLCSHRSLPII